MRTAFAVVVAAFVAFVAPQRANASIAITVDKSAQTLTVAVNGVTRYRWPVSTARWGYNTPNGSYRPQRLERQWYSRKYDWSPMPYSIFFAGGYAIHGSYEVSRLGRPASHGCIRLHPRNAAILFDLVRHNVRDTHIIITGDRPEAIVSSHGTRARVVAEERQSRQRYRHSYSSFEEVFSEPPSRYRASRRPIYWDYR